MQSGATHPPVRGGVSESEILQPVGLPVWSEASPPAKAVGFLHIFSSNTDSFATGATTAVAATTAGGACDSRSCTTGALASALLEGGDTANEEEPDERYLEGLVEAVMSPSSIASSDSLTLEGGGDSRRDAYARPPPPPQPQHRPPTPPQSLPSPSTVTETTVEWLNAVTNGRVAAVVDGRRHVPRSAGSHAPQPQPQLGLSSSSASPDASNPPDTVERPTGERHRPFSHSTESLLQAQQLYASLPRPPSGLPIPCPVSGFSPPISELASPAQGEFTPPSDTVVPPPLTHFRLQHPQQPHATAASVVVPSGKPESTPRRDGGRECSGVGSHNTHTTSASATRPAVSPFEHQHQHQHQQQHQQQQQQQQQLYTPLSGSLNLLSASFTAGAYQLPFAMAGGAGTTTTSTTTTAAALPSSGMNERSRPNASGRPSTASSTTRHNLYFNNLPTSWNTTKLREVCSRFGVITSAKVAHHGRTNESLGHGFILFERAESAAACKDALHGQVVRDGVQEEAKTLQVSYAHASAAPNIAGSDDLHGRSGSFSFAAGPSLAASTMERMRGSPPPPAVSVAPTGSLLVGTSHTLSQPEMSPLFSGHGVAWSAGQPPQQPPPPPLCDPVPRSVRATTALPRRPQYDSRANDGDHSPCGGSCGAVQSGDGLVIPPPPPLPPYVLALAPAKVTTPPASAASNGNSGGLLFCVRAGAAEQTAASGGSADAGRAATAIATATAVAACPAEAWMATRAVGSGTLSPSTFCGDSEGRRGGGTREAAHSPGSASSVALPLPRAASVGRREATRHRVHDFRSASDGALLLGVDHPLTSFAASTHLSQKQLATEEHHHRSGRHQRQEEEEEGAGDPGLGTGTNASRSGLHPSEVHVDVRQQQQQQPEGRGKDESKCNVYLTNLPLSWNTTKLCEVCSPFGTIVSAKVPHDEHTNESRGYGFVFFERPADAAACIAGLHHHFIPTDQCMLSCRYAKERATPVIAQQQAKANAAAAALAGQQDSAHRSLGGSVKSFDTATSRSTSTGAASNGLLLQAPPCVRPLAEMPQDWAGSSPCVQPLHKWPAAAPAASPYTSNRAISGTSPGVGVVPGAATGALLFMNAAVGRATASPLSNGADLSSQNSSGDGDGGHGASSCCSSAAWMSVNGATAAPLVSASGDHVALPADVYAALCDSSRRACANYLFVDKGSWLHAIASQVFEDRERRNAVAKEEAAREEMDAQEEADSESNGKPTTASVMDTVLEGGREGRGRKGQPGGNAAAAEADAKDRKDAAIAAIVERLKSLLKGATGHHPSSPPNGNGNGSQEEASEESGPLLDDAQLLHHMVHTCVVFGSYIQHNFQPLQFLFPGPQTTSFAPWRGGVRTDGDSDSAGTGGARAAGFPFAPTSSSETSDSLSDRIRPTKEEANSCTGDSVATEGERGGGDDDDDEEEENVDVDEEGEEDEYLRRKLLERSLLWAERIRIAVPAAAADRAGCAPQSPGWPHHRQQQPLNGITAAAGGGVCLGQGRSTGVGTEAAAAAAPPPPSGAQGGSLPTMYYTCFVFAFEGAAATFLSNVRRASAKASHAAGARRVSHRRDDTTNPSSVSVGGAGAALPCRHSFCLASGVVTIASSTGGGVGGGGVAAGGAHLVIPAARLLSQSPPMKGISQPHPRLPRADSGGAPFFPKVSGGSVSSSSGTSASSPVSGRAFAVGGPTAIPRPPPLSHPLSAAVPNAVVPPPQPSLNGASSSSSSSNLPSYPVFVAGSTPPNSGSTPNINANTLLLSPPPFQASLPPPPSSRAASVSGGHADYNAANRCITAAAAAPWMSAAAPPLLGALTSPPSMALAPPLPSPLSWPSLTISRTATVALPVFLPPHPQDRGVGGVGGPTSPPYNAMMLQQPRGAATGTGWESL